MYSVRHPARRYDREYIAYPISVFSLCVACSICRCGSVGKHGGFCFFSFPAVSMISCPHPPAPLPPPGKGESQSLFRRGLRPRYPCTEPPAALADAAVQEPGGWLARQVGGSPCLDLYWLPPSPCPPFPSGRGLLVFLCKGLRPLHPRARAESGTGCTCVAGARRGGLPGRSAGRRALAVPSGWFARQVGDSPCLELYWLPPSPLPPSPSGEGGVPKFISPGATAPGTPALNRLRHLQTLPCRCPAGVPRQHHSQGISFFQFCGEP